MRGRAVAAGLAAACAAGVGLLAVPAADAQPVLPPVSPQELVSSVLTAHPGPFAGTVELDNALGLPALPDLPQAANGRSSARVWSGGDRLGRVALPSPSGERTLVSDGTTFWAWDSQTRTVTKHTQDRARHPDTTATDPAAAAATAIQKLQSTSTITVDGTAEVAGRPAYELVLAPAPTERTLLREVRIAVDAQQRLPLRLTVLANGSTEPALELGFTQLTFGQQDPALFTFTPPPGSTVTEKPAEGPPATNPPAPNPAAPPRGPGAADRSVVGDGWDTVIVAKRPAGADTGENGPDLGRIGTPVHGPWGSGHLITTAVASAIVTDDGRIAFGAVPDTVLTDALTP